MLHSGLLIDISRGLFLSCLTLLTGSLSAQEAPHPRKVRFVLLGDMPGPELPGDEDHLLHLPGEVLPAFRVSVLSGEKALPFLLAPRTLTDPFAVDGASPELRLQKGRGEQAKTWLTVPMPTAPLNLGVLYREHETTDWNKPQILLLDDSPEAFPVGTARFVNVSEYLVLVQIGDPDDLPPPKIFGLPAGKAIQKPLRTGNKQIRVGYLKPNKERRWIWSNKVNLGENQRLQAFFYKAQGKNPRQRVKFHFTREEPPEMP